MIQVPGPDKIQFYYTLQKYKIYEDELTKRERDDNDDELMHEDLPDEGQQPEDEADHGDVESRAEEGDLESMHLKHSRDVVASTYIVVWLDLLNIDWEGAQDLPGLMDIPRWSCELRSIHPAQKKEE